MIEDLIEKKKALHEVSWKPAYAHFSRIIEKYNLRKGAEIGVAFGGHSEAILRQTQVATLYAIDSYQHRENYQDPMNLPQPYFDTLYQQTKQRLSAFGERFQLIRAHSKDAVELIEEALDFVYIDADHSYKGVWDDLCSWFSKVRDGGVIGGHDYGHQDFPGVKQAIDEFFRRFNWEVHLEGEGVWWIEKQPLSISFFIPAFNCEKTIQESVESIMEGNFEAGDELVILNDCSTDNTAAILDTLKTKYPSVRIHKHIRNKGGAAARNTAIENTQNSILFCLDSDNILASGSIQRLKRFMVDSGADAASFQEVRYFQSHKNETTHTWTYEPGAVRIADYLSKRAVPGASGNYMFTNESWIRAGCYPEFARALDTWGFGFQQLTSGSKMFVLPDSYYRHRYGHESYWVREHVKGTTSLIAIQILIPFLNLLAEKDVDYIMGRPNRYVWFDNLPERPIRLKDEDNENDDKTAAKQPPFQFGNSIRRASKRMYKYYKVAKYRYLTRYCLPFH